MQTFREMQETYDVVRFGNRPRIILDDGLAEDDQKYNRKPVDKNEMVLAFLGICGFVITILIIGFS